jgi:ornithine carbamoyltransferase
MTIDLRGRDFLRLHDYSRDEIQQLLDLAIDLKREVRSGTLIRPVLAGKSVALIFRKPSTRTRLSFEVGVHQLGGQPLFISGNDLQIGRGETIADTARILSGYLHGIMIRTFAHQEIIDLAEAASVPVINGLTDDFHPCQVLADLQTILEHKGRLAGLKLAYVGDGNNMAHSLLNGCARMGMDVAIAAPAGFLPNPTVVAEARAAHPGGTITITHDPIEAVTGADIVYTDVWASMGQEDEHAERLRLFDGYQVNEALTAHAKPDYLFMHCLPAHRGEEVSAGVMDGPHAVVWDEAENRLHAQKALMAALIG